MFQLTQCPKLTLWYDQSKKLPENELHLATEEPPAVVLHTLVPS